MNRRQFLAMAVAAGAAAACPGLAASPSATAASTRPAMPQRILGRTGVSVGILGLGGAGMLGDTGDRAVLAMLDEAIAGGITFFDTAFNYANGHSEHALGLVMGTERRKGLFLATKCEDRTYDGAMRQVEMSLKRLRTDWLDLIQVHHVSAEDDVRSLGQKNRVLAALQKLRDEKVVRFIGMTGHPDFREVRQALELYEWDTFMGWVNPLKICRRFFDEQLPIAQKKRMGVIAMKAFGGKSPATLVGDGPGKAPAAALLRWALSQPIALAIPSVSTPEQLRENLSVARAFVPMPQAQQDALAEKINTR